MAFRREKLKRCPNNEVIVLRRWGGGGGGSTRKPYFGWVLWFK